MNQRPTSVTVIGWLFIIVGSLAALGGVFGLAMSLAFPMPAPDLSAVSQTPAPSRLMAGLFDHFMALAIGQLVVAAIMVASGRAFLRLRPWARPVFEVLSWLGLVYTLGFGAFWVWGVLAMGRTPGEAAGGPGVAFMWVFVGFGVLLILLFAVPPILLIRALRGRTVREALAQASA